MRTVHTRIRPYADGDPTDIVELSPPRTGLDLMSHDSRGTVRA
jgi:hypothetical protein